MTNTLDTEDTLSEKYVDVNPGVFEVDGFASRGASFRSLTSYASFRSCRTYKSSGDQISHKNPIFGGFTNKDGHSKDGHIKEDNTKDGDIKDGEYNLGFYDCKEDDSVSFYSVKMDGTTAMQKHPVDHLRQIGLSMEGKKEEGGGGVQVYLAYTFSLLAGLLFTASNVLVGLNPELDAWSHLIFRSVIQVLVMLLVSGFYRTNPLGPPALRVKIFMLGIVGGILLLAIYLAIKRVHLGDAAAIFFTAPIFTMILAFFILKEQFGIFRTGVLGLFLAGVLLLTKPSFFFSRSTVDSLDVRNITLFSDQQYKDYHLHLLRHNVIGWPVSFNQSGSSLNSTDLLNPILEHKFDVIGGIAAFSVPILSAYLLILVRQCKEVQYSVLVLWLGVGALVVSLVGQFTLGHPTMFYGAQAWGLSFLMAGLGLVGNILLCQAVIWLDPGKVMVLRSVELVAVYILQIAVFKTTPHWIDLGGNILVMSSILLLLTEDAIVKHVDFKFF